MVCWSDAKARRIKMVKFFAKVLVALVFLVGAAGTSAQDRVRVGWAAMTASHTPLWVAQEKGFIAKQGLSAELIFFGAGPPAMDGARSGSVQEI